MPDGRLFCAKCFSDLNNDQDAERTQEEHLKNMFTEIKEEACKKKETPERKAGSKIAENLKEATQTRKAMEERRGQQEEKVKSKQGEAPDVQEPLRALVEQFARHFTELLTRIQQEGATIQSGGDQKKGSVQPVPPTEMQEVGNPRSETTLPFGPVCGSPPIPSHGMRDNGPEWRRRVPRADSTSPVSPENLGQAKYRPLGLSGSGGGWRERKRAKHEAISSGGSREPTASSPANSESGFRDGTWRSGMREEAELW